MFIGCVRDNNYLSLPFSSPAVKLPPPPPPPSPSPPPTEPTDDMVCWEVLRWGAGGAPARIPSMEGAVRAVPTEVA